MSKPASSGRIEREALVGNPQHQNKTDIRRLNYPVTAFAVCEGLNVSRLEHRMYQLPSCVTSCRSLDSTRIGTREDESSGAFSENVGKDGRK